MFISIFDSSFLNFRVSFILKRFNLRAFATTQKLERDIAAAANMGLSCSPKSGIKTPAAIGIPIVL